MKQPFMIEGRWAVLRNGTVAGRLVRRRDQAPPSDYVWSTVGHTFTEYGLFHAEHYGPNQYDIIATFPTEVEAHDFTVTLNPIKEPAMSDRYGRVKRTKIIAARNEVRRLIQSEGTPAIQDAWDRLESWIDSPPDDGAKRWGGGVMTNYNSAGWRTFRRVVPLKVRWLIGIPVFACYLFAATANGFLHGVVTWYREIRDCIAEYPSFWGKDR